MEEVPGQEKPAFEQQPVARHDLNNLKPKWWKRRNVIVVILLVVVIGGALGLIVLGSNTEPEPAPDPTNNAAVEVQQPASTAEFPAELLYAYWEGDSVRVRSLDWKSGEKTDVFDFISDQTHRFDDLIIDNPFSPPVSFSAASNNFAFVNDRGLNIYERDSGNSRNLISKESDGSGDGPRASPEWSPDIGSIFAISHPQFSPDGSFITYTGGLYEGNVQGVFNVGDATKVDTGETYRYADFNPGELNLAPAENNGIFKTINLYPGHYYKITGAEYYSDGVFSPDGSVAAMALNILDDNQLVESTKLVLVRGEGEITELDEGNYIDILAFSKDGSSLFATRQSDSGLIIEEWNVANGSFVNRNEVKSTFAIPGTVVSIDLHSFDKVYASIKTKISNSEYKVIIVDVAEQDQVAEFLVDDQSSFSILFAKQ